MVHLFAESLAIEARWAPALDRWLGQYYRVVRSSLDDDRAGVDRWLTRPDGSVVGVDYKIDVRSAETGRYFVELISNDERGSPGWAVKPSRATFILFFTPPRDVVVVDLDRLRAAVEIWKDQYRRRAAANKTYQTIGICVPRAEVEAVGSYSADILFDAAIMETKDSC